jgi:hypothetical protein
VNGLVPASRWKPALMPTLMPGRHAPTAPIRTTCPP